MTILKTLKITIPPPIKNFWHFIENCWTILKIIKFDKKMKKFFFLKNTTFPVTKVVTLKVPPIKSKFYTPFLAKKKALFWHHFFFRIFEFKIQVFSPVKFSFPHFPDLKILTFFWSQSAQNAQNVHEKVRKKTTFFTSTHWFLCKKMQFLLKFFFRKCKKNIIFFF